MWYLDWRFISQERLKSCKSRVKPWLTSAKCGWSRSSRFVTSIKRGLCGDIAFRKSKSPTQLLARRTAEARCARSLLIPDFSALGGGWAAWSWAWIRPSVPPEQLTGVHKGLDRGGGGIGQQGWREPGEREKGNRAEVITWTKAPKLDPDVCLINSEEDLGT